MNIAEQIKNWLAKRATIVERMAAIMALTATAGAERTLTADEQGEYDRLANEQTECTKHLERLELLERANARLSIPAAQAHATTVTAPASAPAVVTQRNAADKFEGQSFVRMTIARTLGQIEGRHPAAIAKSKGWDRTNPDLFNLIAKANEIPSHGSATGDYGAELVQVDQRFTGDFINFLWAKTIYNQLGLREVPANVMIKGQDGVGEAFWVGEGRAIGVTVNDFMTVNLSPLKVATLAVMSQEWLRDSSPSGELLVRDALVNAARQKIDGTFLSNTAAVSGVSPAGIFNGTNALGSAGWTADNVREDVKRLVQVFIDANNADGLHWVMSQSLALALSLMVTAFSVREFPGINAQTGGEFFGYPVAVGGNLGRDVLALVKPSDIYRIGNEGIRVELSRDASIEMSRAPSGDAGSLPPTTQSMVSMFQTDSVALKVVLPINFQKRRSHAAQWIADAQYGESGTVTA